MCYRFFVLSFFLALLLGANGVSSLMGQTSVNHNFGDNPAMERIAVSSDGLGWLEAGSSGFYTRLRLKVAPQFLTADTHIRFLFGANRVTCPGAGPTFGLAGYKGSDIVVDHVADYTLGDEFVVIHRNGQGTTAETDTKVSVIGHQNGLVEFLVPYSAFGTPGSEEFRGRGTANLIVSIVSGRNMVAVLPASGYTTVPTPGELDLSTPSGTSVPRVKFGGETVGFPLVAKLKLRNGAVPFFNPWPATGLRWEANGNDITYPLRALTHMGPALTVSGKYPGKEALGFSLWSYRVNYLTSWLPVGQVKFRVTLEYQPGEFVISSGDVIINIDDVDEWF